MGERGPGCRLSGLRQSKRPEWSEPSSSSITLYEMRHRDSVSPFTIIGSPLTDCSPHWPFHQVRIPFILIYETGANADIIFWQTCHETLLHVGKDGFCLAKYRRPTHYKRNDYVLSRPLTNSSLNVRFSNGLPAYDLLMVGRFYLV